METAHTTRTPGDLAEFIADVFASLPRTDQRTTSSYYLQGLMLEGRRKSMQPMAERLGSTISASSSSSQPRRGQSNPSAKPWPPRP